MNSKLSLLYIEDNLEVLENVTFLFERYVDTVYTATDGEEALEQYFEHKPDIVVSDISLPKMSGSEVAKRIREDNLDIPIIMMTACNDSTQLAKAIDIGVSSYITKPFTLEILKSSISKAIEECNQLHQRKHLEEKYELINKNVLVLNTNTKFIITEVTDALIDLTGYSKEELIGSNASIVKSGETPSNVYENLFQTIASGHIWNGELKNKKKNGDFYWISLSITPLFDRDVNIKGYTSIQANISKEKETELKVNIDSLTSINNRTLLNKITENSINIARRHNTELTYMMIDIDHFKAFNDTYGHQNGDEVLRRVAQSLKINTKREQDHAFRVGGEEFTLILLGLNPEESIKFANKIKEDILKLQITHERNSAHKYLSVSVGIYVAKGDAISSKEEMYALADKALYKAKANGRNQVSLFG
ncbi:MAG: diguanylate cyclase [Sulfurimonas sp.]|nr:diguanylate cyclase [Sulfurimonas sp.]